MATKTNLFVVTDSSSYESSVLTKLTGFEDHEFICVVGYHRGYRATYLDGNRLELHEVSVRELSEREAERRGAKEPRR